MDSTVKPALVLMSGRSAAMAATFLLPVVLARVFDPAGFGTYKQLFLVSLVLYQVGVVFAETLFYFLPRSPERAGQYVANSVLALTAAGCAGLALLWLGAPAIGRWLGNPELARYLPLMGAVPRADASRGQPRDGHGRRGSVTAGPRGPSPSRT